MIDLTMNDEQLKRTVERARERNIIIPTFEQMKDPEKSPARIKERLKKSGSGMLIPSTSSGSPGRMNRSRAVGSSEK